MKTKRIITLLLLLCLVITSMPLTAPTALAEDDDEWYTYNYSYWKEETASPNAYSVTNTLYGMDIDPEIGNLNNPKGLFCIGNLLFICDTGNNRIIEAYKDEEDGLYKLSRIIYQVNVSTTVADAMQYGGKVDNTLFQPTDIFVKPMTEELRRSYGDYLGDPYIYPGDDSATEQGGDAEPTPTEEPKEDAADETETGDSGESGDGGESGEGGEATPTPTPVPQQGPKKDNVVRKQLDNEMYDLFIADKEHKRVIHCDYNLNVINVVQNPVDDTLPKNYEFKPNKIVADNALRVYAQADGINSGLMEFDQKGEFTGYVGASKVVVSLARKIWRKLQTRAQRNRSTQFVPTEYNNLSLDSKGFIYATISAVDEQDLWAGTATPIRKLNAMGSDILIRNGNSFPIGDLAWSSKLPSVRGASKFTDVIAFENETYACLDMTRGKIFVYDFQGNLLYAFGGIGFTRGRFSQAIAMDNLDEETILVLDTTRGTITEFSMTRYGKMINEALQLYKTGYYDESAKVWDEILQFNGNFELAYVGIGRALLRQEQYKEAMGYFESAHDIENYSKAFQKYREEVVEKYIFYAILALVALIFIPKIIRKIIKVRREIKEA